MEREQPGHWNYNHPWDKIKIDVLVALVQNRELTFKELMMNTVADGNVGAKTGGLLEAIKRLGSEDFIETKIDEDGTRKLRGTVKGREALIASNYTNMIPTPRARK